ncbi:MAG: DUF3795 domain-containing protein [Promethearchaeota archaeon]
MKEQSNEISNQIIGACGLICSNCKIYNAPNNLKIAEELVEHFQGKWEDVRPQDFHCGGCWSDINELWSPDCWIRKCCVNDKNYRYCCECSEFPCLKLDEWAKKDKGYEEALERLKEMKKNHGL